MCVSWDLTWKSFDRRNEGIHHGYDVMFERWTVHSAHDEDGCSGSFLKRVSLFYCFRKK
jgi:hypothetical protein